MDIMLKRNICNNIVVKYIIHPTKKCIIMENAIPIYDIDYPLIICGIKTSYNLLIYVFCEIVNAIKSLYDIGLYYTDIKFDNILYRSTGDKIEIFLCDLGSISELNDFPMMSFAPYEIKKDESKEPSDMYPDPTTHTQGRGYHPYSTFFDKNIPSLSLQLEKEKIIVWEIGILMLELLGININTFYSKIKSDDLKMNEKIIQIFKNQFPSYHNIIDIIEKILFVDYRKRITLKTLSNVLSKLKTPEVLSDPLFKGK